MLVGGDGGDGGGAGAVDWPVHERGQVSERDRTPVAARGQAMCRADPDCMSLSGTVQRSSARTVHRIRAKCMEEPLIRLGPGLLTNREKSCRK